MTLHTLRNALKARIARMVEFRAGFKEEVAYFQTTDRKIAEYKAGQYLANVNIHLNPVIDLIDVPYWAVRNTNGPSSVISKLEELKAALNGYANTPIMESPAQHLEAAMSIIDDQLTDDLQHLSTPA